MEVRFSDEEMRSLIEHSLKSGAMPMKMANEATVLRIEMYQGETVVLIGAPGEEPEETRSQFKKRDGRSTKGQPHAAKHPAVCRICQQPFKAKRRDATVCYKDECRREQRREIDARQRAKKKLRKQEEHHGERVSENTAGPEGQGVPPVRGEGEDAGPERTP